MEFYEGAYTYQKNLHKTNDNLIIKKSTAMLYNNVKCHKNHKIKTKVTLYHENNSAFLHLYISYEKKYKKNNIIHVFIDVNYLLNFPKTFNIL